MTIDGKVPDFVNVNGQKKLIELFGDYWHSAKMVSQKRIQTESERIGYFKQFGWSALVIWEHELEDLTAVREKILRVDKD